MGGFWVDGSKIKLLRFVTNNLQNLHSVLSEPIFAPPKLVFQKVLIFRHFNVGKIKNFIFLKNFSEKMWGIVGNCVILDTKTNLDAVFA